MTNDKTLEQFLREVAQANPDATVYAFACSDEWEIADEAGCVDHADASIPMGDYVCYVQIRRKRNNRIDIYLASDERGAPSYQVRLSAGPYRVREFGDRFGIVLGDDPDARPVGEKLYDDRSNAHRRKRQLNAHARRIDEMIKKDGAIIV